MANDQYLIQCTDPSTISVSGNSVICSSSLVAASPDPLMTVGDYQGILLLALGCVALAWGFRALGSLIYRVR